MIKVFYLVLMVFGCMPWVSTSAVLMGSDSDPRRSERHDDWPSTDDEPSNGTSPNDTCYVAGRYRRGSDNQVTGCVDNALECWYSIPCN